MIGIPRRISVTGDREFAHSAKGTAIGRSALGAAKDQAVQRDSTPQRPRKSAVLPNLLLFRKGTAEGTHNVADEDREQERDVQCVQRIAGAKDARNENLLRQANDLKKLASAAITIAAVKCPLRNHSSA